MKGTLKICVQCEEQFKITPNDLQFYNKLQVPEPDLCPECRRIQLMCWRNERTFYSAKCAECGVAMVSCFSENSPLTVYCSKCWWSDKWDPLAYGSDFDFKRPFFDQFHDLMRAVPIGNLFIASSENSDYANYSVGNKNCYMAGASDYNQDSFYVDNSNNNRNVCDVSLVNKNELIYDSVDIVHSYMCSHCQNLTNCNFCYFCADLIGCSDCVGCVGLRNVRCAIFNKKYSKEDYEIELKKLALNTHSGATKAAEKFQEFKRTQPRKFSNNVNSENVSGSHIVNSKNCENCFDIEGCKDCKDFCFGHTSRDCRDVYGTTASELLYFSAGIAESYDVKFSCLAWPGSNNIWYSFCTRTAKNCFGCISLRRNENCILNKQYSPEEYKKMFSRIRDHMIETGEWGRYFPIKYAPWAYNETVVNDFYPKTREKVLALGWKWEDNLPGTFGKGTIKKETLPEDIKLTPENLINEIFECDCNSCGRHTGRCSRNYKIIKQELAFYKKIGVPLPQKCPSCRYFSRTALRTPRKLWQRQCMCAETSHQEHAPDKCHNVFLTAYSPNSRDKIFCEDCYRIWSGK